MFNRKLEERTRDLETDYLELKASYKDLEERFSMLLKHLGLWVAYEPTKYVVKSKTVGSSVLDQVLTSANKISSK
jgi:hypothetical protein